MQPESLAVARPPLAAATRSHAAALVRLAVPMIVSRTGLAAMAIADAIMVARYDSTQFAMLSLADGTLGRLNDIFAAFVLGGLILVPRAFGAGDLVECARIWRRSVTPAIALGFVALLAGFSGAPLFHALGQSAMLGSGAGRLAAILGCGSVAALLALGAAVFLEGLKRPTIVAASVVAANALNIGLNWLLIGGHGSFPAFGARGSAIATTVVRFALAIVLVTFAARAVAGARSDRPVDVEQPKLQRRLGLSSAIVGAIMLLLTASLTVFAGRLGPSALAALAAAFTLNAPVMLFVLGMADATGIRVAAGEGERARSGDALGPARAIVSASLLVTLAVVLGFVVVWCAFPSLLARIFTHDSAPARNLAALVPFASGLLVADGMCFVAVSALRALRDVWWPTGIELATMAALVPLAAWLAFRTGEGVRGLVIAALVTAGARALLLLARFLWLTDARRSAFA